MVSWLLILDFYSEFLCVLLHNFANKLESKRLKSAGIMASISGWLLLIACSRIARIPGAPFDRTPAREREGSSIILRESSRCFRGAIL